MDDRKRKWIYWSTVLGASVPLVGLGWAACGVIGGLLGLDANHLREHVLGFAGLSICASSILARRLLQHLGLSIEGKRTETHTCGGEEPAQDPIPCAAVASAHPWALGLAGLITGGLALAGVGLAAAGTGPGWVAAALLVTVSTLFWRGCISDARFACTADNAGVTSHSLLPTPSRSVPWEQIGECRIQTGLDAIGRPASVVCTLFDHAGKQLLRLDLGGLDARERERFLDAVRTRLSVSARAELIAAEAPAGLGTEPEAAPAPAGRGTEPEASGEPAPAVGAEAVRQSRRGVRRHG